MKKQLCLVLLSLFIFNCCKQKSEDTHKTYLAEKYQYKVRFGRKNTTFERKGWLIEIKNKNGITEIHEYAPPSEFYEIYSAYFPDETLNETYQSMCDLKINEWLFYDDNEKMFGSIESSGRFWNSIIKKRKHH